MSRTISKPNAKDISPEKLADLKHTASLILAETRMNFQRQQPFVGSISMNLNLIPTRDIDNPTAATDGLNIYFDIDFLSRLDINDRMFILGHEVYHNVMLHFMRQENRDRNIWNIAADMEVNTILAEDGLTPPASAILPEKYGLAKNKSAEEYYEMLSNHYAFKHRNSTDSNSGNNSGNSNGELQGQFDKHIYADEKENSGAEKNDVSMSDKYGKLGKDEDYKPNVKPEAVEKIREAAIAAAQQIERSRGELPAHLQRLVDTLLEAKVDWRDCLAQYVTRCMSNDPTWSRPNRRFAHIGTYLPGHQGNELNVAVILDTSGSTAVDTERFLSELHAIVESHSNYKLTIVHCDATVQHVDEFDNETPFVIENGYEMHGGGGTKLKPAFDYIDVNDVDPSVCIVFTDGHTEKFTADMAPNYPTLWLITEGGTKEKIEFGEVIEFDKAA
jgi:predicted metal-dependent peptidase